ncbi:Undecaprenyl phosphate-alpha-4-amino-4-deoxy-L-arabinose arabinosyl transferase [Pandoraea iniqua]|uniref:Undecaprenyl phosphate-alpha-4-amino-4-deoxy-L-arabinose arabinosyl transferase n=1 Tax=Pandoraea iniqua TaxID=2508288 RepID=A0A5E4Z750_9BURK|nr:Undecaprenyl phosphate-alpha-4-amino-4-deoxy-L-arabinose arabinosyl transferase [Pandoraea iniqua]
MSRAPAKTATPGLPAAHAPTPPALTPAAPYPLSPAAFWTLLIGFALVWFGMLDYRHLIASDEGRYAEMAREMWTTGDWITPRYNGYKYFEKPPLQTWMNALTFAAFGLGEWQARLWTALTGFAGVLMVGYTGRRVFNARVGLFAAAALASAPLWALLGHFNVLDMGLSFFMGLSLCALLLAQRPGLPRPSVRGWMWLCWAAMALAVLSKGLVGIVLPGAVLVLYTLVARDWALWKRLYLGSGLIVFFLIAAPWFVLVQMRNPEFFDFFFINEHFRRFAEEGHNRDGALWYFVPVFLVGFLPWLSILPGTVRATWRMPRQPNGFAPTVLMWTWSIFIFVFFSVSHSKLISYLLPIAPAMALLFGLYLAQMRRDQLRVHLAGYAVFLIAALVMVAIFVGRSGSVRNPNELYKAFQIWLYFALGAGLVGTLVAWRLARHSARRAVIMFAAAMLLLTTIGGMGHEVFGRQSSGVLLVPAIKAEMQRLGPDTPFYSVNVLDHTMPFYLGTDMIMVQHPDELEFGVKQEPQKWLPTLADFYARWRADPKALALVDPDTFSRLEAEHLPMRVIARDARRVVISKPLPQDNVK